MLFSSVRWDLSFITGTNIAYLLGKYDKPHLKDLVMEKFRVRMAGVNPISDNEEWKVKVIKEIFLLKGYLKIEIYIPHLEEIFILSIVCTD